MRGYWRLIIEDVDLPLTDEEWSNIISKIDIGVLEGPIESKEDIQLGD